MECQKVVAHKSNGAPKICGRDGITYVLKGGLASAPAILCDRHSSAFRREGYLLERPVTDVAPVFTVDPIAKSVDNVAATDEVEGEALPAALPSDSRDSERSCALESDCDDAADASGEAAPEMREPATDPVVCVEE